MLYDISPGLTSPVPLAVYPADSSEGFSMGLVPPSPLGFSPDAFPPHKAETSSALSTSSTPSLWPANLRPSKRARTLPAAPLSGWVDLAAARQGFILQHVREHVWPRVGPTLVMVGSDGFVLPFSSPLQHGQALRAFVSAPEKPFCLPALPLLPADTEPFFEHICPSSLRLDLLGKQGLWMADDQVAFCLRSLAQSTGRTIQVIDPLKLLAALQRVPLGGANLDLRASALMPDVEIISAVPCLGHWVTFHWRLSLGLLHAWASDSRPALQDNIAEVNWLVARQLNVKLKSVRFHFAPLRPVPPGLCGQLGLGDLAARLSGQAPPPLHMVLDLPAYLCSAFEVSLRVDSLVRMPLLTAGALGEFVGIGLASLLRTKGVSQEDAGPRAQAAVQQIGAAKIQAAMASPQPWREIKALANQASPAFQLVLPSELEASLATKAGSGQPVGQTRKQKKAQAKSTASTEDIVLLPEQVSIPTGVFTSPSGPLQQIRLDDVGPSTAGIVVVTPEQATRYLRAAPYLLRGSRTHCAGPHRD